MNIMIKTVVCILILALAPTANLLAQNADLLRLRMELERTDELIERAHDAVRESNSALAGAALEKAFDLQKRAWANFREACLGCFKRAAVLTIQAREQARFAIANGFHTEQNTDRLLRRLEKTTEMVERVREMVADHGDDRVREVLEMTIENLHKAWEFYRTNEFRPAIKLIGQVETTVRKILEIARRDQRLNDNLARRLQGVEELLHRSRELAEGCEMPQIEVLLEEAFDAFDKARQYAEQGRPEAALRMLQTAHKLATEVTRACSGADRLMSRYERLMSRFERLVDKTSPGNADIERLLEQAESQLELARTYLSENHYEAAAAALRAAQLILAQAEAMAGLSDW